MGFMAKETEADLEAGCKASWLLQRLSMTLTLIDKKVG